jgi:hypothetical protein
MICESCRRDVDYVRASYWHADAMICRECLAQWCDPDNVYASAGGAASVGNYVRLQHGLPTLAAILAFLLLGDIPPARASRHCLDHAEAARTWPTLALMRDGDGCWTYGRRPARNEAPAAAPAAVTVTPVPVAMQEATLADRWRDANMIQLEQPLEPKCTSEPASPAAPVDSARQFALFVWIVLAIASVVEVTTGGRAIKAMRPRWPARKASAAEAGAFSGPFPLAALREARPAPRRVDRTGGG